MKHRVPTVERRAFAFDEVQVEVRDDGPTRIKGHSAVFNSLSEDLGWFREIIRPGAFAKSIGKDDVRALFNHNPDVVLGRTKNGTLQLREDTRGLYMECEPPDTQQARDVVTLIKRGDVSQQSFGFSVISDQWRMENGEEIRELHEVQLWDVSPVTYPAYTATDVSARDLLTARGIDFQGLSRAMCKQLRGETLTPADRDIARRALRLIADDEAGVDAQAGAGTGDQADPLQARRLSVWRSRLQIAALF